MIEYPPIFELDEVATIVGMPKSLAKNWTIGRPLKITPSVRTALGKGSRNLYGLEDVLKMALAYEMSEAGLNAKLIQRVLVQLETILSLDVNKALQDKSTFDEVSWLIIGSRSDDVDIELHSKDLTLGRSDRASVFVYHAIDFRAILVQVFKRLESLRRAIAAKDPTNGKQKKGREKK